VLVNSKLFLRHSQLAKSVRPFVDKNGIIRCCSGFETENAPVSDEIQFPILLLEANSERFVRLLIEHIYFALKHARVNQTLLYFQKHFWMPRGRQQIYSVLTKCRPCARKTAKSLKQPVDSQLPLFRLQPNEAPLLSAGLDMCGPFQVIQQDSCINCHLSRYKSGGLRSGRMHGNYSHFCRTEAHHSAKNGADNIYV